MTIEVLISKYTPATAKWLKVLEARTLYKGEGSIVFFIQRMAGELFQDDTRENVHQKTEHVPIKNGKDVLIFLQKETP